MGTISLVNSSHHHNHHHSTDENNFTVTFNDKPVINVPENFVMKTSLHIESEDGSYTTPYIDTYWNFDTTGNRAKYDYNQYGSGTIYVESSLDFNKQIEHKYDGKT